MIRIPDQPGLPQQQINAPTVSPAAANAPNAALGSIAQSIASVGAHFQQVADDAQKLENARAESAARMQLQEGYSKLQQDLDKDPTADRVTATRDYWNEARGIIGNPDLSPQVRDSLKFYHDEQASNANIEAGATQANIARKRAGLQLSNEIDAATKNGDIKGLKRALATGREAGVVLPEQEDKLVEHYNRTVSGTTLDLAINEDPKGVLADMEQPDFFTRFPGLSKNDIPRLQDAVRISSQRKRTEEMDLFDAALETGELLPQDLEGADYITPGDVAKIKKAMVKVDPPTAEEHGKVWDLLLANRQIFADPSISDKDYADRWNTLRAEVIGEIPPQYRGDISAELSQRSPANRSAAKTKPRGFSEAPELKAIGLDRITRARAAGMFGPVDEDADPVAKEKAYRRAEELRVEVARFVEANKDGVDIEKVTEFTDKLITGDKVKTTASQFQNYVPGGAQRLRPVPSLPALPPKSGAKDKATTDPMQIPPGSGEASDALLPPRAQLENFLK